MSRWKTILRVLPPLLALLANLSFAQNPAQRPAPHIGFVYPAGGQKGTTLAVSIGGQNLSGDVTAYFTSTGVTAKFASYERPLTGKETQELRDELQKLQEKRTEARADATLRRRVAGPGRRRPIRRLRSHRGYANREDLERRSDHETQVDQGASLA